jgi:hypothetical protein
MWIFIILNIMDIYIYWFLSNFYIFILKIRMCHCFGVFRSLQVLDASGDFYKELVRGPGLEGLHGLHVVPW